MASIKYKIYKNNSSAGMKDKFYARAYHDETIDIEELAEHMSNHNTPYSKGTIHGVLKDMVACIRELLLDSKKVKLDNLAIFSLGLSSRPANSPEEFMPSSNIIKAYINAIGTGEISKKQLDITARFKEVAEYDRGTGSTSNPSDDGGGSSTPKQQFTISLQSANEEQGSVTGGGTYDEGSNVTITATPKSGYQFDKWSDGNTSASRTLTVTEDLTLTATFKAAEEGGGDEEDLFG